MEKEKINLNVSGETHELTIRYGDAPVIREPLNITITGNITSAYEYLLKREGLYDLLDSYVTVDKQNCQIQLITDASNSVKYGKITGEISKNTSLNFILDEKPMSLEQLKKLIRNNRMFFKQKDEMAELLAKLEKLRVDVQQTITDANNRRGNVEKTFQQTVSTDVVLNFTAQAPVYNEFENDSFLVEIFYNVRSQEIEFWLESVELKDLLQLNRESILNNQIELIKTNYPSLAIFYK